MKKLLLFLLIGIALLSSCKSGENKDISSLKIYVVSEADAFEETEKNSGEDKIHTFTVGGKESYDNWYISSKERRQFLHEFRNLYEQDKDDFEFQKRNEFKNVKAIIDGEMIFGYKEGSDLDKTFEESLVEPDVKSDSVYTTQSGKGGGFR